jgi:hypothetical protein
MWSLSRRDLAGYVYFFVIHHDWRNSLLRLENFPSAGNNTVHHEP